MNRAALPDAENLVTNSDQKFSKRGKSLPDQSRLKTQGLPEET
jgi:hypothetical protein